MTVVLTLLGGVAVGIVVLYVEYTYFRKKKQGESITESVQHKNVSPLWIDAVNSAVVNLCKRVDVKLEAIPKMKVENDMALVTARTWANGNHRYYDLKIDKNGDMLEIHTR